MAYDTVLDYLKGTLRYWNSPSTIYVGNLHGYPDFLKIGFCQVGYRNLRRSDEMIKAIPYETCNDRDFLLEHGDLCRADAFLFEQWIHHELTHRRELIPELEQKRWNGRYETYRVPESEQKEFIERLRAALSHAAGMGWASREQILQKLVTTAEEQRLLEDLKLEMQQLIQKRKAS